MKNFANIDHSVENTKTMFKLPRIKCIWIVVLFSLAVLSPLLHGNNAAAQETPAATVIAIRGDIHAGDSKQNLRKLKIKSELFQNDTITTGKRGRIQIMFTDNTIISLGRKSSLQISEYFLDKKGNTGKLETKVTEGVFRVMGGMLTKISPDNFNTQTPSGNIGIRGSMYTGKVADGETAIVFEGGKGITFKNQTGMVVITEPGNGTNVNGMNSKIPEPRKFSSSDLNGFSKELTIRTTKEAGKSGQTGGDTFSVPATFSPGDLQNDNSGKNEAPPEDSIGENEQQQEELSEDDQILETEELTDKVKENPEEAANLLKDAIVSQKIPVEKAMEAVLKGMNKPNKEEFSQLINQALEMGITLDSAKELVKTLKENGGICK